MQKTMTILYNLIYIKHGKLARGRRTQQKLIFNFQLMFRCKWKESESVSSSVMSDTLRFHGLQPTRLLCPWYSPGKKTGVGSQFLLQGIFPTQWLNLGLFHCRWILYCLSHQGRPVFRWTQSKTYLIDIVQSFRKHKLKMSFLFPQTTCINYSSCSQLGAEHHIRQ